MDLDMNDETASVNTIFEKLLKILKINEYDKKSGFKIRWKIKSGEIKEVN